MKKQSFQINLLALISIWLILFSYTAHANQSSPQEEVSSSVRAVECPGDEITKQTPNTEKPALVTSAHRFYTQECFKPILSRTIGTSSKPFVFFISGRGQHPSKELEHKLLPKIEQQYGVTAVMFTWPSWCGPRCFPQQKALESSNALLDILQIVESLKQEDKVDRPYALLTHSMGAFVLQGLTNLSINELPGDLFDNIIVSAAAVQNKDHKNWINKINFGLQIYITANQNDKSLRCLESDIGGFGPSVIFCRKFKLPERLGRWGVTNASNDNTSTKAIYLGYPEGLGKTHRYYINQEKKAPKVFNFYSQVFQGKSVQLGDYEEVIPTRVYKLKN